MKFVFQEADFFIYGVPVTVERISNLLNTAIGQKIVVQDIGTVAAGMFVVVQYSLQTATDVVVQDAAVSDREQDLVDTKLVKGKYTLLSGAGDQGAAAGMEKGTGKIGQGGCRAADADSDRGVSRGNILVGSSICCIIKRCF